MARQKRSNKPTFMTYPRQTGFTFIEIVGAFAIIMVLASIAFIALNPKQHFQRGRDTQRISDITAMMEAIKLYSVDHGGAHIPEVAGMPDSTIMMIGQDTSLCDSLNAFCDSPVASGNACVDLSSLVGNGYLSDIKISPEGKAVWSSGKTGYTLEKSVSRVMTIRACESESSSEIFLSQ